MNLKRSRYKLEALRALANGPQKQADLIGRSSAATPIATAESRRKALHVMRQAGLVELAEGAGMFKAHVWNITEAGRKALAEAEK